MNIDNIQKAKDLIRKAVDNYNSYNLDVCAWDDYVEAQTIIMHALEDLSQTVPDMKVEFWATVATTKFKNLGPDNRTHNKIFAWFATTDDITSYDVSRIINNDEKLMTLEIHNIMGARRPKSEGVSTYGGYIMELTYVGGVGRYKPKK